MKLYKTTLTTFLLCLMNLPCSSANHNENPFKIFIDFLKQEMLYHHDVVYYPFPFEDITYNYEEPKVETDCERIRQLICDGISYNKSDSCADYTALLELPHRIKIQALNKDRYRAEAFVTLPDSSATLRLDSTNIGIPQIFDSLEVTLMQIEDNVAYLLIEDKSELIDYSYTRPEYIDKEDEDEEDAEEDDARKERKLASPYQSRKTDIYTHRQCIADLSALANDGFRYFQRCRIIGVAYNAEGKKLAFETLSEDFRHYLWYRNMDMPYGSMEDDYRALQERFPSPEGDNRYHLLQVVRLEASGRLDRLDIHVLSHSTRPPLHLQLEENFNPRDYYADKPSLEEMTYRISTIRNIHPDSISSRLTVTPYGKCPRRNKLQITAFLPASYNAQYGQAELRFTRLTFPYETDSITLERNYIQTEDFMAGYLRHHFYHRSVYGSAAILTEIPFPNCNNGRLTGEVKYYYPNFEAVRYDLPDLPEGVRYENDTLFFSKKKAPAEDENSMYNSDFYTRGNYYLPPNSVTAYDESGKMLPYRREDEADGCKMIFERPVKAIISIWRKDGFSGKIPFSMPLPPFRESSKGVSY